MRLNFPIFWLAYLLAHFSFYHIYQNLNLNEYNHRKKLLILSWIHLRGKSVLVFISCLISSGKNISHFFTLKQKIIFIFFRLSKIFFQVIFDIDKIDLQLFSIVFFFFTKTELNIQVFLRNLKASLFIIESFFYQFEYILILTL